MHKIWKSYLTKNCKALISNYGDVIILKYKYKCYLRLIRKRKHIGSVPLFHIVYKLFVGEIPEGCVLHHIDENKLNDSVYNLRCMTIEEHTAWHAIHRSEETLEKISNWAKSQKRWNDGIKNCFSKEYCEAKSEAMSGENNPFYGKTHTEEVRKRISESHKGKSPANKGVKMGNYYNNKESYKMFYSDEDAIEAGYFYKGKKYKEQNNILK